MKRFRFLAAISMAIACTIVLAGSVNAEIIYGLANNVASGGTAGQTGNQLVRFVTTPVTLPGRIAVQTIGTLTPIQGHLMRSIDVRPVNGLLYALSTGPTAGGSPNGVGQLYTVNVNTAALTPVGSTFLLGTNTSPRVEMDFNPVTDRIRIVTGATGTSGQNNNFTVNPNDGTLVSTDTNLFYDPTDDNAGQQGYSLVALAYSNNNPGASQTTAYGWDYLLFDLLVTIGGVNGAPAPSTGAMFSVNGPIPSTFSDGAGIGMDISGATGILYTTHNDPGDPDLVGLFTRPLTNGAPGTRPETNIGYYPVGTYVVDIAVARSNTTAANVTIEGRLTTGFDGRNGLMNATVVLRDSSGMTRTAISGKGGRFVFDNVESGQVYTISVKSRTYRFDPQIIEVRDSVSGLTLVGEPIER